jgi:hypothetical protein
MRLSVTRSDYIHGAHSSDLAGREPEAIVLRLAIMLSLTVSVLALRRWPFQNGELSAFIAHCTAASKTWRESCKRFKTKPEDNHK